MTCFIYSSLLWPHHTYVFSEIVLYLFQVAGVGTPKNKRVTVHAGLQCTYIRMLFCCIALCGHCALCSVISWQNFQGDCRLFLSPSFVSYFVVLGIKREQCSSAVLTHLNFCTLESYTAANIQVSESQIDLSGSIYLISYKYTSVSYFPLVDSGQEEDYLRGVCPTETAASCISLSGK